jgi:hypothetical protein
LPSKIIVTLCIACLIAKGTAETHSGATSVLESRTQLVTQAREQGEKYCKIYVTGTTTGNQIPTCKSHKNSLGTERSSRQARHQGANISLIQKFSSRTALIHTRCPSHPSTKFPKCLIWCIIQPSVVARQLAATPWCICRSGDKSLV